MPMRVDVAKPSDGMEALMGRCPDFAGWSRFEDLFVSKERLAVEVSEGPVIRLAAACRLMLEVLADDITAQILPIRARIGEVQVLDGIDDIGWDTQAIAGGREVEEALVFLEGSTREWQIPSLLFRQALDERHRRCVVID